jgi:hypothetical protein
MSFPPPDAHTYAGAPASLYRTFRIHSRFYAFALFVASSPLFDREDKDAVVILNIISQYLKKK